MFKRCSKGACSFIWLTADSAADSEDQGRNNVGAGVFGPWFSSIASIAKLKDISLDSDGGCGTVTVPSFADPPLTYQRTLLSLWPIHCLNCLTPKTPSCLISMNLR
jgi:hypothetical protein